MKIGGNGPAFDFFSRNGGSSYLGPGTESKSKYTSSVARAYKEELTKRVQEDARGGPVGARVAFPGLSLGSASAPTVNSTKAGDDDFFEDWDKPASKPAAPPTKASSGALPGIGARRPVAAPVAAASATSTSAANNSGGSSGFSTPERSATPTTTSSKTLNARTGAGAGARKGALGATKISSGGSVGASKKLGGVKKAAAPINFEEAERKAREEEAKAKALEEQALKEKESFEQAEAMAKAAIQAASASQAAASASAANGSAKSDDKGAPQSPSKPIRSSQETERLGMGFGKLSLSAARVAAQQSQSKASSAAATSLEEPDYARSKFANQKSISSDQYFERGGYDPNMSSEAKERLQGFSGQTSISSNQYFGRDEDEDNQDLDTTGEDWAGDFEATARDYYQRLMANPDVQSGIEGFRAGAMKLSQYLEDLARNGG